MAIFWRESLNGFGPVLVMADPYCVREWKETVAAISGGRTIDGPLHVLVDARYCSPPSADFVVRAVSALDTQESRGGRVAVVVNTDAAYGMGRLAEATADVRQLPFTVRTFRDWRQAERWLVP